MSMKLHFLEDVARDLPIIRPIKEFIHLNLLLPYQHLNFWEALTQVSAKLEAMPLADMNFYREKIKGKEIPLELIEQKIRQLASEDQRSQIIHHILKEPYLPRSLWAGKVRMPRFCKKRRHS